MSCVEYFYIKLYVKVLVMQTKFVKFKCSPKRKGGPQSYKQMFRALSVYIGNNDNIVVHIETALPNFTITT